MCVYLHSLSFSVIKIFHTRDLIITGDSVPGGTAEHFQTLKNTRAGKTVY